VTGDATDPPKRPPRRRLGLALSLALSFVGMGLGALLFIAFACVWVGTWTLLQLTASLALVLLALAVVLVLGHRRDARRLALGLALVGLLRLAPATLPIGRAPNPAAPIRSRWLDTPDRTPWFARLPERECVRLGAWALLMEKEWRTTHEFRDFLSAYDDLERDRDFESPDSVVLDSWLVDRGHYWLAVPDGPGPFPLLVFLHGHVGNFQAYAHWIAPEARRRGIAVAFPSEGFGLWPDAPGRVDRIVAHLQSEVKIDTTRLTVAGLSNGGPAAFAVASAQPGRWKNLVTVSGAMPTSIDPARLAKTRVLLIHGEDDPRTPIGPARDVLTKLQAGGVDARMIVHPEDHLILARRSAEVVGALLEHAKN
jgi:dienelactone hydrolase